MNAYAWINSNCKNQTNKLLPYQKSFKTRLWQHPSSSSLHQPS